jgi:transposase
VIELDPHEVGQDTANWTTERLAGYLGQHTGTQVTEETVRVYLHAHDYVCKRPTWTDASARPKRKPITWETHQGRGSLSRCHSTRTSTRS